MPAELLRVGDLLAGARAGPDGTLPALRVLDVGFCMVEQPCVVQVRFMGEEPLSAGESGCCAAAVGSGSVSTLVSVNACRSTQTPTIAQQRLVSAAPGEHWFQPAGAWNFGCSRRAVAAEPPLNLT